MTYQELKDFCSSLNEEQLKQEVYLSHLDGGAIRIICGHISEEDEWFDHCDSMGNAAVLKEELGDNWEEEAEDYTKVPKGTVMLCDE